GWVCLWVQDEVLARLDERLFRQRASEELGDGAGDPVARAAEAGVLDVARLSKRAGGRLTDQVANPRLRAWLRRDKPLVFEEKCRVFVPGKQPEQDPVGELDRAPVPGPGKLEQPAVLGDRPDVLDPLRGGR